MNHADPNTMRAKARGSMEFLRNQLLETGTIEPMIALLFHDHIEQVRFQDPSILEYFDLKTMHGFDYVRRIVGIKRPQSAMIALDVRMGAALSEEIEVLADMKAIFLMLDSPLLTIQVILPYSRLGGGITFSREQFTEMSGGERESPCLLFKLFPTASALTN